jgi:hypothetical protein
MRHTRGSVERGSFAPLPVCSRKQEALKCGCVEQGGEESFVNWGLIHKGKLGCRSCVLQRMMQHMGSSLAGPYAQYEAADRTRNRSAPLSAVPPSRFQEPSVSSMGYRRF